MGQVDVTGQTTVARQVGVIEDVVIETVRRQDIALVVRFVQRPVVAQAFGAQHQYAVIAQLAVLDDGQGLEGLAQAHTVGNDAAAEAFQLVDGSHHAVTLELVQLLPDHCVADARGGFDDALFVHTFAVGGKEMLEHERVDAGGVPVCAQLLDRCDQGSLGLRLVFEGSPLHVEPLAQHLGFCRALRCLNQAQRVAGRNAKAFCAEGERAQHCLLCSTLVIAQDHGALGNGTRCIPNLSLGIKPSSELTGEPRSLKLVAGGSVCLASQQFQLLMNTVRIVFGSMRGNHQTCIGQTGHVGQDFSECEQ